MICLSSSVEPSAAERQGAMVLVDPAQETLGLRVSKRNRFLLIILHIVTTLPFFPDISLASSGEGLDGILLILFHLSVVVVLDNGHTLASMDTIGFHAVSTQVPAGFHLVRLLVDGHLVALHHLLYGSTHVFQSHVYSRRLYASVSSILSSQEQVIILLFKSNSEGTVNNASFDLSAKVYFADVVLLNDGIVSVVGGVVGCHVVEGTAGGEGHSCIQA